MDSVSDEPATIPGILQRQAAQRPAATALIDGEQRTSYGELATSARRIADDTTRPVRDAVIRRPTRTRDRARTAVRVLGHIAELLLRQR